MHKPTFLLPLLILVLCLPGLTMAQDLPEKLSIATWNLEWFFDDVKDDNGEGLPQELSAPSRDEWEWKLGKVAEAIAEMQPTIIALQEIEDRDAVYAICNTLKTEHNLNYRYAFVGGYEFATEQDVAIMYQDRCIVEYGRKEQTGDMYSTKKYYPLGKHMFARFQWGNGDAQQELLIFNLHLRAKADKESIRKRQCELVRHWIQDSVNRGENVIVLGDFNTEHNVGAVVAGSDVEIIKGSTTESTEDDLIDLHEQIPENARQTHITSKQLDRIFVSDSVFNNEAGKKDLVFSNITCRPDLVIVRGKDRNHFNGFYDIPQDERDISDHYPVIAEFLFK